MKPLFTILLLLPIAALAQFNNQQVIPMHQALENLYNEMMPMCSQLIRVGQTIACFGALFYIGFRIWKHIANAEPVDFFPLLRPFALSIAIAIFPQVLGLINGVLKPVTMVTEGMVKNTHADVDRLLRERDLAAQGKGPSVLITDPGGQAAWDQAGAAGSSDNSSNGFWSNLLSLDFTQLFKMLFATLLEILYYAASLCIDCMRTFHLIILAILGPLVFALAVYDGFQHTLAIWFARYINIYLWLPIANLFGAMIGKVQEGMLRADIADMQNGGVPTFSPTDLSYLVFMVVGIVGYVSIPSIANYVVHASGGSAIMSKTNSLLSSQFSSSSLIRSAVTGGAGGGSSGGLGGGTMASNIPGDDRKTSSMADAGNSNDYQHSKISGTP